MVLAGNPSLSTVSGSNIQIGGKCRPLATAHTESGRNSESDEDQPLSKKKVFVKNTTIPSPASMETNVPVCL